MVRGSRKKDAERNNELENTIGNLLISEHQATRLKKRLVEEIGGLHAFGPEDDEHTKNDESTFPFVFEGKLYKIHLYVEKVKNEIQV